VSSLDWLEGVVQGDEVKEGKGVILPSFSSSIASLVAAGESTLEKVVISNE